MSSVDELTLKMEVSEKEIEKKNSEVKELRNAVETSGQKAEVKTNHTRAVCAGE